MDKQNIILVVRFCTKGSITKRLNVEQQIHRLATFLLNLVSGNPLTTGRSWLFEQTSTSFFEALMKDIQCFCFVVRMT